jgi:hypothetical protein
MGYRNRRQDEAEQRFIIALYMYAALFVVAMIAMLAGDLATMLLALIIVLSGGIAWLFAVLGYMLYSLFVP